MADRAATPKPGGIPARPELREFQRAYKACVPCRKRKSRCELTADEYSTGRPCTRCRRERKDCIFTAERQGDGPSATRAKSEATTGAGRRMSNAGGPSWSGSGRKRTPGRSVGHRRRSSSNNAPGAPMSFGVAQIPSVEVWPDSSSRPTRNGLPESMLRTVVASGSDALNLLFEAAHQREEGAARASPLATADSVSGPPQNSHELPPSGLLEVWDACRFVKMGWFGAAEAVLLVDLFFQNISHLSPILTDFYQQYENHCMLVTEEPMLCCTILAISCRYHNLPGTGGISRGYLIHERLWDHCQHLILRIVLGQEKGSKTKTRTLGTIEALLLLTEWHPRALHFPPPNDGWDSDLLLTRNEDGDRTNADKPEREKWLDNVINPARRSDRMSWMMVSCALSLALELGVFDDPEEGPDASAPHAQQAAEQRVRLRKLLFLYIEQLALRLGCKSIMPQSVLYTVSTWYNGDSEQSWHSFIGAWIELTKLVKSMADMLFPSRTFTYQLLHSGRYVNLIAHFQLLLVQWSQKHLQGLKAGSHFHEILSIEYQSARIYANSLGLQAVVERIQAEHGGQRANNGNARITIDSTDYNFTQAVVEGSLEVLQTAIKLGDSGALTYSPVRIFLRVTAASVFLIKGLGLGASASKLRAALDVLSRCITALKSGVLDDVHLGSRYATLLEMHVVQLQNSFVASDNPPSFATRPPSAEQSTSISAQTSAELEPTGSMQGPQQVGEDWLTLPFDPSLVPFVPGDSLGFSSLTNSTLDFMWNLNT